MIEPQPQDELAALKQRVQVLEDHLAILALISRWGPAADTADAAAAAALWSDDAVLEAEGDVMDGPGGVFALIDSVGQRELVAGGCAHVQSLPLVHIEGDDATATNYGRVYVHGDRGFEVWRVSVNHWEFRRTDEGWRARRRIVQLIDGRPEARELLSRASGHPRNDR